MANFITAEERKSCKLPALVKMTGFSMQDYDREERKRISMMRTITNYGMGIFFLCAGIFFLFHYQLGFGDEKAKLSALDIIIGIMFLLYGGWRIYRGYKKDYFK